MYVVPKSGVPAMGGVFELAAQLSEPDERLYYEVVHGDNYVDQKSWFSIGLFEKLGVVFAYFFKAASDM